jgi:hypothetical protein
MEKKVLNHIKKEEVNLSIISVIIDFERIGDKEM